MNKVVVPPEWCPWHVSDMYGLNIFLKVSVGRGRTGSRSERWQMLISRMIIITAPRPSQADNLKQYFYNYISMPICVHSTLRLMCNRSKISFMRTHTWPIKLFPTITDHSHRYPCRNECNKWRPATHPFSSITLVGSLPFISIFHAPKKHTVIHIHEWFHFYAGRKEGRSYYIMSEL